MLVADLIRLVKGDITDQDVDAIVNAANSSLLGGGGVDGAIHRRGGPAILTECRELRRSRFPDGLDTGDAVPTGAGNLRARFVIHTVGPVWSAQSLDADSLLASAYRRSLQEAQKVGARTVAFPSISTGAYRFPMDRAAHIALTTVRDFIVDCPEAFDEIRFVLFSDDAYHAFAKALERISDR